MNTSIERKCIELVKFMYKNKYEIDGFENVSRDIKGYTDLEIIKEDIERIINVLFQFGYIKRNIEYLALSDAGESWAQELINQENNDRISQIPLSEIEAYINNWLPQLNKYGEFSFPPLVSFRIALVQNTQDAEIVAARIHEIDVRNMAMQYLIFEGFAINRHDIGTTQGILFHELTKRGRNLLRCGTLERFYEWEQTQQLKRIEKSELELNLLRSQDKFQELNNQFVTKQSELIESQIQTNELTKITNVYIAIFTGIAGEYYISELLRNYIPFSIPYRAIIIYALLVVCIGAGIFGFLRMRRILRRKYQ